MSVFSWCVRNGALSHALLLPCYCCCKPRARSGSGARRAFHAANHITFGAHGWLRAREVKRAQEFGPDRVFAALYDECFSKQIDKYTYEVCPFGKATQREGSSSTSLGTFDGFSANFSMAHFKQVRRSPDALKVAAYSANCGHARGRAASFAGATLEGRGPGRGEYSAAHFALGARSLSHYHARYMQGAACWQGPSRTLTLHLRCGTKGELLGVDEPERCTYKAAMDTPAACDNAAVQSARAELHDLLGEDDGDVATEL